MPRHNLDMDARSQDSLKLTPSRVRTALLFAAMVVWFLLGMSRYAATGGILPLGLSLVGLAGAAVYGLMLLPGSSYLQADAQGLTISTAFRKRSYAWSQAGRFRVETLWSRQVVKYTASLGGDEDGTEGGQAREETLPDTYGLSPEELADRLNALRRRYG